MATATCVLFQPPPYSSVANYTRACFDLASSWIPPYDPFGGILPQAVWTDWPPAACQIPCVNQRALALPSPQSLQQAIDRIQFFIPPNSWLRPSKEAPLVSNPSSAPIRLTKALADAYGIGAGFDLFSMAVAMLIENRDIVDWLGCQVEEWKRLDSRYARDSNTKRCVSDALDGDFTVYFVSRFLRPLVTGPSRAPGGPVVAVEPVLVTAPATGSATGLWEDGRFDPNAFRSGAVMPVEHPNWIAEAQALAALNTGGALRDAVAAVAHAAGIILHEWMHLCSDAEDDGFRCFAVQNMLETGFYWAIAQRFPDLQYPCFPKSEDHFFMSSDPEGSPDVGTLPFRVARWQAGGC